MSTTTPATAAPLTTTEDHAFATALEELTR